jgi:hypothetical protein
MVVLVTMRWGEAMSDICIFHTHKVSSQSNFFDSAVRCTADYGTPGHLTHAAKLTLRPAA